MTQFKVFKLNTNGEYLQMLHEHIFTTTDPLTAYHFRKNDSLTKDLKYLDGELVTARVVIESEK